MLTKYKRRIYESKYGYPYLIETIRSLGYSTGHYRQLKSPTDEASIRPGKWYD